MTFNSSGYHGIKQNITFNTSADVILNASLYDGLLNLVLFNNLSGLNVTNQSVNVLYADGTNLNYSSSTAIIPIYGMKNSTMNISKSGASLVADFSFLYNLTNMTENYTYAVYTNNSLRINILNIDTGAYILTNVTIQLIDANETMVLTNTTDKGFFNFSGLPVNNYTLEFTGANLSRQTYSVQVTAWSTQVLNAYMLLAEADTYFTIKDSSTREIIEGATFTTKRLINNTWTIISVLSSDITGRVFLGYTTNKYYRFIVTKDGYNIKEFELNPIAFASYNVWLETNANITEYGNENDVDITYNISKMIVNKTTNITFNFASPTGSLISYSMDIIYRNTTYTSSGVNAYGGILNRTLNLSNATTSDFVVINYYWLTSNATQGSQSLTYMIEGTIPSNLRDNSANPQYGLGILERIIIYLLIVLFVAWAGFIAGGVMSAGILSIIVAGFFVQIGFLSIWIVIPSIVILGFMVLFGGLRNG